MKKIIFATIASTALFAGTAFAMEAATRDNHGPNVNGGYATKTDRMDSVDMTPTYSIFKRDQSRSTTAPRSMDNIPAADAFDIYTGK